MSTASVLIAADPTTQSLDTPRYTLLLSTDPALIEAAQRLRHDVFTSEPGFALAGATRYGVLRDSLRLSDLRGKTVVLAFFYRARTKG